MKKIKNPKILSDHPNNSMVEAYMAERLFKKLTTEFEVRDALGGEVTGDYQKDLKRLEKKGQTCDESVYNEAYQMTEQP